MKRVPIVRALVGAVILAVGVVAACTSHNKSEETVPPQVVPADEANTNEPARDLRTAQAVPASKGDAGVGSAAGGKDGGMGGMSDAGAGRGSGSGSGSAGRRSTDTLPPGPATPSPTPGSYGSGTPGSPTTPTTPTPSGAPGSTPGTP